MQTSAAVSHTMCAHVGSPRNWGTLGPAPLGFGAWLTRRNTLLPTCVSFPN